MPNIKGREIAITLNEDLSEWLKDYRYMRIMKMGDFDLTLREIVEEAIRDFRKRQPAIEPRPDAVKKNEEKKLQKKRAARQAASQKKKL